MGGSGRRKRGIGTKKGFNFVQRYRGGSDAQASCRLVDDRYLANRHFETGGHFGSHGRGNVVQSGMRTVGTSRRDVFSIGSSTTLDATSVDRFAGGRHR